MNIVQATGAGGVGVFPAVAASTSSGATIAGGIQDDADKAALAHGLVMALVTLVVAPLDLLVGGALRRWPVLRVVTSFGYLVLLLVGLGLGVKISAEYLKVRATSLCRV